MARPRTPPGCARKPTFHDNPLGPVLKGVGSDQNHCQDGNRSNQFPFAPLGRWLVHARKPLPQCTQGLAVKAACRGPQNTPISPRTSSATTTRPNRTCTYLVRVVQQVFPLGLGRGQACLHAAAEVLVCQTDQQFAPGSRVSWAAITPYLHEFAKLIRHDGSAQAAGAGCEIPDSSAPAAEARVAPRFARKFDDTICSL